MVQTFGTNLSTQYYSVYGIVLKWLESKKIDICLKLRDNLRFCVFLNVFDTFTHKMVQTWFVRHETWHKTVFGI